MESMGCLARDLPRTRIQVHDGRRRIGLVFWVQRRRLPGWNVFWKRFGKEFERTAAGLDGTAFRQQEAEGSGIRQAGAERTSPERAGVEPMGVAETILQQSGGLSMAWEWEAGLRSRIFRLRRPNIWARLHYGLDKDGVYSPKIELRGRRELKKLCLAGIPVSSCPPLLGESPAIDWALIPYGFEEMA